MTEQLSIHFHKKEAEREGVSSQNCLYPKAKKLVIWSWGMDPSTQISHWLREVCSASKTDTRFPKLRTAYWQRLSVVAIESKHLPGAPVHMCDCVCAHTHTYIHTHTHTHQYRKLRECGQSTESTCYSFTWTWLESLSLKIRHLKPRDVKYISQSHKTNKKQTKSKIHPFSSNHF